MNIRTLLAVTEAAQVAAGDYNRALGRRPAPYGVWWYVDFSFAMDLLQVPNPLGVPPVFPPVESTLASHDDE